MSQAKPSKPGKAKQTPRATLAGIDVWCRFDEASDPALLVPNPRNPNDHPDKQIALLAKIIRHQGWRQPITVSKRSGLIVKGHGRLQAAQVLNVDQVPVEHQDYKNEAAEMADMLADNRIAKLAEPDQSVIQEILADPMVFDADFDMDLSGYSVEDLMPVNFEPGTEEDQGKLDELSPKIVLCPHCNKEFDLRGHEQS